jgi:AcrR family transcriptional regulator
LIYGGYVPQTREHTSVRRHQIIDAARKVILERGSENITIKALADEVGLSEAAIYRHFLQKQDVLLFLIDDIGESLLNDLKYASGPKSSSLSRIGRILKKHISSVEQRRGVSFQIIAEIVSLGDKRLNERVAQIIERYTCQLEALLAEGIASGEIRADLDPKSASALIFSTIHGLVSLWTLKGYGFNLRKKFDSIWLLVWSSMANQTLT